MLRYFFEKLMFLIGYRKVWYYPSDKGLSIADFYKWQYCPKCKKKVYTETNYPYEKEHEQTP